MRRRKKLLRSLRNLTVVGASSLAGCTATPATDKREGADSPPSQLEAEGQAEGEESAAGEGEGEEQLAAQGEGVVRSGEGEGEGGGAADLASDDVAYLTQLGLMRGHLHVGYELFKAGHLDAAKTHMKHPEHELYADVAPAFEKRGTGGFAEELEALSAAVETGQERAKVDASYTRLLSAIARNEAPAKAESGSPSNRIQLAAALVRVAADEYKIAVVDGKMENAHEYQDAMGFTTVARGVVSELPDDLSAKANAAKLLDELLDGMWPSLIPPKKLETAADQLYGAAARLDLLAASQ